MRDVLGDTMTANRVCAICGLLFLPTIVPALGTERSPPWRICAQAEIIVAGTIKVSRDGDGNIRTDNRGQTDIQVGVDQQLKGSSASTLSIRYYAKDEDERSDVFRSTLLQLDSKSAILFLISANDGFGSRRWYFAGDWTGVAFASNDEIRKVKLEIARQRATLQAWKPHTNGLAPIVAQLIGEMTKKENENGAFRKLQLMGSAAVVPIIDAMDDHRTLPLYEVEIQNISPKQWEGLLHYDPKEVVDGLDIVLNQLTGEDFGEIENGGTDDERALDVTGWRIYEDVLVNHREWLREPPQ